MASLIPLWVNRHREEVFASIASANLETTQARAGVLILDPQGDVVASTADAGAVLANLPHQADDLPLCLTAILAWLAGHPEKTSTPQVPVRDRSGQWIVVQAHRLDGAVAPGTLTVSVADAQPQQLVALAMAAAGLTRREREVSNLVLAGLPTTEIAAKLYLSSYTVQDHLKSIFAKFGVSERRQLMALLLHESDTHLASDVHPMAQAPPF